MYMALKYSYHKLHVHTIVRFAFYSAGTHLMAWICLLGYSCFSLLCTARVISISLLSLDASLINYSQFVCKFLCNNDDSDWLALSGLLAGRISRDYHVVTRSATSKNKSKAVSAIPLNAVASQAKICSPGDCCYSLSYQILSKVVFKCEVPKYFLLSSGC